MIIGLPLLNITVNEAAKNDMPNKNETIAAKDITKIKIFMKLRKIFTSRSKK